VLRYFICEINEQGGHGVPIATQCAVSRVGEIEVSTKTAFGSACKMCYFCPVYAKFSFV
jgi:hypothetical protein